MICVKNIDLPQKLRRKAKKSRCRQHKKVLGRSIEERPSVVNKREEFGHWETDLVIGSKSGEDNVLLTLLERKTRQLEAIRLPDKSAESVIAAFQSIRDSLESISATFSKQLPQITVPSSQSCQNWSRTLIQRFTLHTPIAPGKRVASKIIMA